MKRYQHFLAVLLIGLSLMACGGGGGGGGTGSGPGGGTPTPASIAIDPSSSTLFEDGTLQLSATAKDSGGNTVAGIAMHWTSSDTNVATIDNAGRITGLSPGTTTVTASSGAVASPGVAVPVLSTGVLKGSVNFTGPYPAPGTVNYVTAGGFPLSVQAYPGQVIVHFDVAASGGTGAGAIAQREANIAAKNGTVIGKIPRIGFYLVQVPAGQENTFLQAMLSGGYGVVAAAPNRAAVRGGSAPVFIDDTCWIDSNCGGTPVTRYVPLNVGAGIVVLDDFNLFKGKNHGEDVYQTAVNAGGTMSAKVQLPLDANGGVPPDKMIASIVAVQQGAALFSPGQNVTANLSFNAGEEDEPWYDKNWEELAVMVDTAIKAVKDSLPAGQKGRFTLVQEIGNSGQDVSAEFHSVSQAAAANGITGNHLYVGGSDGSYATRVDVPADHGGVAWYPGCISPGYCGSSFAAPAVTAFIDQAARQANVPVSQATPAVLAAVTAIPGGTPAQIVAAAVSNTAPVYTLTVATAGTGSGTVGTSPPGLTYNSGTVVTLTATPAAGSTFAGWSGACTGTGTCVVTMDANKAATATFTLALPAANVTGTWDGTLVMPGASYPGCSAQTTSFSLSLNEDVNRNVTGSTSNGRTITSGSRNGNSITVTLSTMFGTRGPYAWNWNGANTITGSMAYFCYDLGTGALLSEGTETFSVSRY